MYRRSLWLLTHAGSTAAPPLLSLAAASVVALPRQHILISAVASTCKSAMYLSSVRSRQCPTHTPIGSAPRGDAEVCQEVLQALFITVQCRLRTRARCCTVVLRAAHVECQAGLQAAAGP